MRVLSNVARAMLLGNRLAAPSTRMSQQERIMRVPVNVASASLLGNRLTVPSSIQALHCAYSSSSSSHPLLSAAVAFTAGACLYSTSSSPPFSECSGSVAPPVDRFAGTKMYPETKPYNEGRLKVSELHTIAYSEYGNPNGKVVLFVHGGPGGGTSPEMARYFDPSKYRVVLVDQRGCGSSTPFAELRENTTWDLVRDFESLRASLGIEKWMVFGGSWGSTLGLAYAVTHPSRVTELVLRGIFLVRKKELDWFYQGPGASFIFPEDWEKYEAAIPPAERGDLVAAFGKRLRGELGEEEMKKAAKAWSVWEGRTSKLVQDKKQDDRYGDDLFSLAFARIENHVSLEFTTNFTTLSVVPFVTNIS